MLNEVIADCEKECILFWEWEREFSLTCTMNDFNSESLHFSWCSWDRDYLNQQKAKSKKFDFSKVLSSADWSLLQRMTPWCADRFEVWSFKISISYSPIPWVLKNWNTHGKVCKNTITQTASGQKLHVFTPSLINESIMQNSLRVHNAETKCKCLPEYLLFTTLQFDIKGIWKLKIKINGKDFVLIFFLNEQPIKCCKLCHLFIHGDVVLKYKNCT